MSTKKSVIITLFLVLVSFLVFAFFSNLTLRYLYYSKIWAHKTNTIDKLNEAASLFSGIELDVVYHSIENYFEVNHPPDKSIHLSLADFLSANSKNKTTNYWLDFKNLDASNALKSAHILDSLTKLYKIKNHSVIVESMNPQFLKAFKNKSFCTSYYLPINLNKLDENSLLKEINKIRTTLNSSSTSYISFDYKDYIIANKYFHDTNKIVWFIVYGSMNKIAARLLLFQICKDDKVAVLLIPYQAKKGNL